MKVLVWVQRAQGSAGPAGLRAGSLLPDQDLHSPRRIRCLPVVAGTPRPPRHRANQDQERLRRTVHLNAARWQRSGRCDQDGQKSTDPIFPAKALGSILVLVHACLKDAKITGTCSVAIVKRSALGSLWPARRQRTSRSRRVARRSPWLRHSAIFHPPITDRSWI
jgi:hypothetical protein